MYVARPGPTFSTSPPQRLFLWYVMESAGSPRWIWQAFCGTIKVRKRQSITIPLQPIPEEEGWLHRSIELVGALWSTLPSVRLLEFSIYYLRPSLIAVSCFINLYVIDTRTHRRICIRATRVYYEGLVAFFLCRSRFVSSLSAFQDYNNVRNSVGE